MFNARFMKKGMFLFSLFCTAGIIIGSGAGLGCVAQAEAENVLDITEITNEKYTRVEVKNLSKRRKAKLLRSKDEQLVEFAEKWELDLDTLTKSSGVIIQQQTFALDDGIVYNDDGSVVEGIKPSDFEKIESDNGISPLANYNKDTVNDYMKLNTVAYTLDDETTAAGNPVFKIVGNAKMSKQFKMRNREEIFTITGGANSVYCDSHVRKGLVAFKLATPKTKYVYEDLAPNYSTSFGVLYKFRNKPTAYDENNSSWNADLASISGTHFLIITNDSSVQITYVHNEDWWGNNLTINIGHLGYTFKGSHTEYVAEPVTLYYK